MSAKNSPESMNPYIEALRSDSVDPVAKERSSVRVLSFTVALAVVLLIGMFIYVVYSIEFRRPSPYVVEIDDVGRASYGGSIGQANSNQLSKYTPAQLASFIENWRSVTPDSLVQKRNIKALYCMIPTNGSTRTVLGEYFKNPKNNPFEVSKTFLQEVKLRSVLHVAGSTYAAEWVETVRNHSGGQSGTPAVYKANMTISTTVVAEDCKYLNPLGVYVTDINWSQVK